MLRTTQVGHTGEFHIWRLMKHYPSPDEQNHAEWSETLPGMQTKMAPPNHPPVPLKDVAPKLKAGQAVALVSIFLVPTLFFMFFNYQLYFFALTHTQTLIVAGVLTPVCIFLMLKHRANVKQRYLVPRTQLGVSALVGIALVPFALIYGWLLMLFSVALLLPGTSLDSKVYIVKELSPDRARALRCRPEMSLKAWPGLFDADFCAEDITPPIQVGEPVVVRGYFSKRAVYVLSVSRPS